ncbi:Tat pathway signal sequence domain protein [Streptomyces sp. P38-E01]|uniref:Tat pathway signal sequence domain protein n=1 Tax=Streptomyces tardus TaxID=2780544 RepID=A0A949N560_9ACTN|nr:Tat pathway signal sequence domain protein [Streptomyces tardus]MBU7597637.1 Tat pathway signal sequence domain protein [Streptomyces tardus]
MRRSTALRSAALSVGVAAALFASAGSATALDGTVLTNDSAGGTAVAVGDVLSAGLAEGTNATFFDSADGSTGVTCATSGFKATVGDNPTAPGTATGSLDSLTLTDCTANILGVTSVAITIDNLPYTLGVDSGEGNPVTISGEPMKISAELDTLIGKITCVYESTGINGSADNADNSIAFSKQEFTRSEGPSNCFSPGYFTATYSPIQNETAGGSPVFVN